MWLLDRNIGKMDKYEESSQDVDITILPNTEQPRNVADSGDTLPHFQFLDGGGSLQNSTDRPIEGFVALKITYEHVFRKQREETRLLQQKNQQLITENQLLKREKGGAKCHTKVEKGPYDTDVTSEEMQLSSSSSTCSDEVMKDLNLHLATLKANKAKLRSGLVRLASCLQKREPGNSQLSDLLEKKLQNLHSLECDSEETRELCSLVEEMCALDESIKLETNQEPGQRQLTTSCSCKDATLSINSSLPSDSSLQQLVLDTNYQQIDVLKCQDSEQEQLSHVTDQINREQSQDEDMYGPEGPPGISDLVPYNFTRLHLKLMKLQQFPSEYRSMTQHMPSVILPQQRIATSQNGSISSSPRNLTTDTQPVSSPSGLPSSQVPSFVDIHSIKLPPTDLQGQLKVIRKGGFAGQAVVYNQELPVTTSHYIADVARQALDTGNPSPSEPITPLPSETEIRMINASNQLRQLPITGKLSDQGSPMTGKLSNQRFPTKDTNISHFKSETSTHNLSYEQARGPPIHSQNITFDVNKFPDAWQSSTYCAPPTHGPREHQHTREQQMSDLEASVSSSDRKECVADPLMTESQNYLVPSPVKTEIADSKRSEWTLVTECPESPYMPGSESMHDKLVTAHTSMQCVPVSWSQMECPVCQQKFPQDTSEITVTSHVNLHFEGTLQENGSFEILDD